MTLAPGEWERGIGRKCKNGREIEKEIERKFVIMEVGDLMTILCVRMAAIAT